MMLACILDPERFSATIYEKNNALGRKFLVAGKGGFNLTHSEPKEEMLKKYLPAEFMQPALFAFDNEQLRDWLKQLGIETYVGTSKRIFPVKGTKPIEVLNAIQKRMQKNKVQIAYGHTWKGWDSNGHLLFEANGSVKTVQADEVIFALGGGSWKVTGSDGSWLELFTDKGIQTQPFLSSNCAFSIEWKEDFIREMEGTALKNTAFRCGERTKKGEAVFTESGIEGSAVYALSPAIREQIQKQGTATIWLDLKPDLSAAEIQSRLERSRISIKDTLLKKINLSEEAFALLKHYTTKDEFTTPNLLAECIKTFPLVIIGMAPLDEAISTVGGIALQEVNEHYQLKKLKHHYCIGEMLDWDAPTGGYLLQACFSMGHHLAAYLNSTRP
jgi:hypothetical protein